MKSFSQFLGASEAISENLKYHIDRSLSICESVFRPGSPAHLSLLAEARSFFEAGRLTLGPIDRSLFEETDLGLSAIWNGQRVPLDFVFETDSLYEAEYQGRKVEVGKPMRGGTKKKYYVYVRNPKSGRIMKIEFGDVKGGLTAKVSDPKARKSFAARHNCKEKTDRTKAGYWACRINRYAHLWGGKTYPGFW